MTRRSKVGLVLATVLFTLFLTLSTVLGSINSTRAESISLPAGNLSAGIFEAQNTDYVENEELPENIALSNIPYYVNMPSVDGAIVGNGHVFRCSDDIYAYVSELKNEEASDSTILNEVGKSLLMTHDTGKSGMAEVKKETGYFNGYAVCYRILNILVSDGTNTVPATMISYTAAIPDTDYKVIMGIIQKKSLSETSTEQLRNLKDILDKIAVTLRYDAELEETQQKQHAEAIASEEAEVEAEASIAAEMAATEEDVALSDDTEQSIKNMAVTVNKDFNSLKLHLYWENSTETPEFTLYNSDKSVSYVPVSQDDGEAVFSLGKIKKQRMIVEIKGSNYGKVTMKLSDAESESSDSTVVKEDTTSNLSSVDNSTKTYQGFDEDSDDYEDDEDTDEDDDDEISEEPIKDDSEGQLTRNEDGSITYTP